MGIFPWLRKPLFWKEISTSLVELAEIGRAAQQRHRAYAREVAAQRVGRARRLGVDGRVAASLTAIGAEIGKVHSHGTAGQRGREMRIGDVGLGGGEARLHVDIAEADEVDGGMAPGSLQPLRRRPAACGGEVEPLEIEIEFCQRLTGQAGPRPSRRRRCR